MAVYTIAQLAFTDEATYRRYQAAFPSVFAKFKAEVVVADEAPVVLEGAWPFSKVVILRFRDEAEALRFANDPDYAAIAQDRKAGADAVVILARGVD
ncbi:MAG: DUF1330 domain-containing protein [Hyphomonas sp.]|uniref:DUF1330 domain-containing protein n=1 Tax=Hyphomonas sp. TaxID=87 RepID=UPI003527D997